MITNFYANNFKSLIDFGFPLSKLTVLIGMNGSGKTTILQAFDFAARMMVGDIDGWLGNRGWTGSDLTSKLQTQRNIGLRVKFKFDDAAQSTKAQWNGTFNYTKLACTHETATITEFVQNPYSFNIRPWLQVHDGSYRILEWAPGKVSKNDYNKITFTYQGSILSQIREKDIPAPLLRIRDHLRNIRSLELISPHLMRQKTRGDSDDVGFGGERLSAFLATIKGEQKTALMAALKQFYPNLVDIKASAIKGGWKRLSIVEDFDGRQIETEARHINDGLLRILAVLAQNQTSRSLLIFDEIENGVNPELIEKLVKLLINSEQQILVTTHSPMILNYLDDDTAIEAVQFVYKNPSGETRVRRFFDIPRIRQKLTLMGPGEAFVDTDLQALAHECILDDEEKARIGPEQALAEQAAKSAASKNQEHAYAD
ncbi:MAG: hypothetical protein RL748_577 [Pseudomonadota bacterium]|jgi:predicted ATPase